MTEEEQQALDAIIPFIREYRDDIGVLDTLKKEAETAFGEDWRTVVPALLKTVKVDDIEQIKANFRQALDYDNAVIAWNEANRILAGEKISLEHFKARIPALEYWLTMFGEAGDEIVSRLKTLAAERTDADLSVAKTDMTAAYANGSSKNDSWDFEYFNRLRNYYDQTMSRVGARCVQLGGLEMSNYPYFDYVLDVLSELVEVGNKLLTDDKYKAIIATDFAGGRVALEKVVADYKYELETNAPPEMVEKEVDKNDIESVLGGIDNTVDTAPIGPAADGFEPIPDLEDVTLGTSFVSGGSSSDEKLRDISRILK